MSERERILNAVSRADVVRVRTIANNPLWLCALVVPVAFVASLIALSLGERAFASIFVGVGVAAVLYAIIFISYFARVAPDRLQSEEYQLEQRRLTLQSKEHPEPRAVEGEAVTEEPPLPQISRGRTSMSYDSFLLTFDTTQMSRDAAIEVIDGIPEITNWYAFLPAAVCLVSDLSTPELNRVIRSRLPDLRFILVRLEKGQRQGWLPKSAWRFIADARPTGKMESAAS